MLDISLIVLRVILLSLLPLQFGLLALGQFFELVRNLLFLLGLLLAFTALDGFVLVLVLIQFEFEKVGQILSALLSTTTATTTR